MTDYIRDHDDAMEAYDRYEVAQRAGQHLVASTALLQALRLETAAARGAPPLLEPTRSVLFRSAASIALDAGRAAEARALIAQGLRGTPPPEIREELLELLDEPTFVQDELCSPAGLLVPGTVRQRLVIRSIAHKPSHPLSMATIAKIQDEWLEYFEPSLERALDVQQPPPLEAVHAAVGSFALELKLAGQLDPREQQAALDVLRELDDLQRVSLDDASPERATESLSRLSRLISLLTILKQEGARLDIEMSVVGEDRAVEVFLTPPAEPLLLRLQALVAQRVVSEDVPQADQLDRVFALVEHVHHHGILPPPEQLDVVKRQISYYRRAAEILGYLRQGLPTSGAATIARASAPARIQHALPRFEASNVGSAWISWAECSRLGELDPSSASGFLSEVSIGLSTATIARRAKTLMAWYEAFRPAF